MEETYKKVINIIMLMLNNEEYKFISKESLENKLNRKIKKIKPLPKYDKLRNKQQVMGRYIKEEESIYINEDIINNIDINGNLAVLIHETYHAISHLPRNSFRFFDEGQTQSLTYDTIHNYSNKVEIKAGYIPQFLVNKLLKNCVGESNYNKIGYLEFSDEEELKEYINVKMKSSIFFQNLSTLSKIYHNIYVSYNKTKPKKDIYLLEIANKIIKNMIDMIILRKAISCIKNKTEKIGNNKELNKELNIIYSKITDLNKYNIKFELSENNYFASKEYFVNIIAYIQNRIRQIKNLDYSKLIQYEIALFNSNENIISNYNEYIKLNKNKINQK